MWDGQDGQVDRLAPLHPLGVALALAGYTSKVAAGNRRVAQRLGDARKIWGGNLGTKKSQSEVCLKVAHPITLV